MMYFLFDRSIFHGDKFEHLVQSSLLRLVKSNTVRIYFTPTFIEETLQFGLKHRAELEQQLKLLFSLNSVHWFRPTESVIKAELGLEYSQSLYYLLTDEEIASHIYGAYSYIVGKFPQDILNEAKSEIARNKAIRERFRIQRLALRKKVPYKKYDFDSFFEDHVEWLIQEGLMKYHPNSANYLLRWRGSREFCKFTEQYLKGWMSTIFLPLVNRSLPVQSNDRADATQLAYLTWADAIVSDDMKFMKEAFQLLHSPPKQFFDLTSFIQYLSKL